MSRAVRVSFVPANGMQHRLAGEGQKVTLILLLRREFSQAEGTHLEEESFLIGHRYRIGKPTVGVRESSQGQVLYTLLRDSIVAVRSFSEDGRSVHVDSEEASLTLFTQDLLPFATLVAAQEESEYLGIAAR